MNDERLALVRELGISLVVDVGANIGQYALGLREAGYSGSIVSFEPIADAFVHLQRSAADDPKWDVHRMALGDTPGRARLNISANSYSSSLLPISARCVDAAPDAAYIGVEAVETATLDALDIAEAPTLLKIDVQGFEPQVLRGARRFLSRVALVEAELSLIPLYEGQELAPAVCDLLREYGFVPVAFDTAFAHPRTHEILQIDAIFRRVVGAAEDLEGRGAT